MRLAIFCPLLDILLMSLTLEYKYSYPDDPFWFNKKFRNPFLGPKLQFSILPKIPETMYPKVNVHKRQSGVNKGPICLRMTAALGEQKETLLK